MNHSANDKHPWEDWQLTAFVLGELEPALTETIRTAAASDAALAIEIAAIRSALAQVTLALKDESHAAPALETSGESRLQRIIETANQLPVEAQSVLAAQPLPSLRRSKGKTLWLGLLGMAAALLVAAWLSFPIVSDWMLASSQLSPSPTSTDGDVATEPSHFGLARRETLTDMYSRNSDPAFAHEEQAPDGVVLSAAGQVAQDESSPRRLELSKQVTESRRSTSESLAEATRPNSGPTQPVTEFSVLPQGVAEGFAQAQLAHTQPSAESKNNGSATGNHGGSRMNESMSLDHAGRTIDRLAAGGDAGGYLSDDATMGGGSYGGGLMGMGGMGMMGGGMMGSEGMEATGDMAGGYPGSSESFGYGSNAPMLSKNPYRGDAGLGYPRVGGDQFAAIVENNFERVQDAPLSTFSIDVDTASYAKCRQLLMEANQLPPAAAVRIEEFINYFDYQYSAPSDDAPVAAHLAVASCPWQPEHQLVRIALQAPKLELADRPAANIVFLLDVSGSMNEPNKLPLVKEAMRMLIEQLGENDRVAMVVYAGAAGCVLESTRGDQQSEILAALDRLSAGGSTNGGDGIQLAYNLARDHYIPGGINRVILCTDGDFNVGVTNTQALVDLVVEQARSKTFLTVLGFGMGNTNDAMMEQISNRGNGVYAFVDSWREAKRQMVQQLVGNLMTLAKDVKLQVEFNPQKVKAYRLLGYENRVMAAEDFNNDKKDAGEIGAGHRVTALYEVVPLGSESSDGRDAVDELRYQPSRSVGSEPSDKVIKNESVETAIAAAEADKSSGEVDDSAPLNSELLAVKLRYKQPEGETSQLRVFPLLDDSTSFAESDADLRWAASMAEFGMLLRGSRYRGQSSWGGLLEQATAAAGATPDAQREESLQMIRRAAQLHGQ